MLISDYLCVLAIVGFAFVLFLPKYNRRFVVLWWMSGGAIFCGVWSFLLGRWQIVPAAIVAILLFAAMLIAQFTRLKHNNFLKKRGAGIVFGSLVLSAGIACLLPLYYLPVFKLPEPDGRYSVGVVDFEFFDEQRGESFTEDTNDRRRLMVRAWYPSNDIAGYQKQKYKSTEEARLESHIMTDFLKPLGLPPYFFSHLSLVRTNAYLGAPIADDTKEFPAIVFSHGYLGNVGTNSSLMENLASHGYIALSVSHPYESAFVTYLNGDRVIVHNDVLDYMKTRTLSEDIKIIATSRDIGARYQAARNIFSSHHLTDSLHIWRDDFIAVTDALEDPRMQSIAGAVLDKINPTQLGYIGMSFGGPAAASACHIDLRCRAAVNLDGAHYSMDLFDQSIRTPLLLFAKGGDAYPDGLRYNDFTYEKVSQSGMRSDVFRYILENSGHWNFTDYASMASEAGKKRFFPDSIVGPIDSDYATRIINETVLTFFNSYIKGSSGETMSGLEQKFPLLSRQDMTRVREWSQQGQSGHQSKR